MKRIFFSALIGAGMVGCDLSNLFRKRSGATAEVSRTGNT